jgi:hypothetical protein
MQQAATAQPFDNIVICATVSFRSICLESIRRATCETEVE